MDPNGNHSMHIEVSCAIVVKAMRILKANVQISGKYQRNQIKALIQAHHGIAVPAVLNVPFSIDTIQYLTIVLIRSTDDDDDVFDNIPDIATLKNVWGLLFVNMVPETVVVRIRTNAIDNYQQRKWRQNYIGLVHTRFFHFIELIND